MERDAWAAELAALQVDEAAELRRRRRELARQSSESANVAGALLDLAEGCQLVTVSTAAGTSHQGFIESVGSDFVAVRTEGNLDLIPLEAIARFSARAAVGSLSGERQAPSGESLVAALSELSRDRPRVVVHQTGSPSLRGHLTAAGTDLLRLQLDGAERNACYVALWSLAALSVTGSG